MSGAVGLRPVEDADLEALYTIQADPVGARMADVASRDREAFDAHLARVRADPDNVFLVIEVDGSLVGSVMSFLREGEREVGYWIDRAQWGRGIASRALALLLAADVRRPLHAGVAAHNIGSQRVLERAGFVPDGVDDSDGMLMYRLDA